MIKKILTLTLVTGMILGVGLLPEFILNSMSRVTIVTPRLSEYTPTVRCSGTVRAEKAYDLLSSGLYEIAEVYVKEGSYVLAGDALAVLKSAENAPFLVRQAQEQEQQVSADWEQFASLASQYGMSSSDLARLAQAEQAEEVSKILTKQDEQIMVTSPIDGVVMGDLPAIGTVVTQGNILCSIQNRSTYLVTAEIAERDVEKVMVGDKVIITGSGFGGETCTGVVERISTTAKKILNGSTYNTVVCADIRITEFPSAMRPGYDVKVIIITGDEEKLVLLPYDAVCQDNENKEYVWISLNGKIEKRQIITGLELADGVQILDGISPGEAVAVMNGVHNEQKTPKIFMVNEG